MRYFLVTNIKFGSTHDYPDVGHKNYKNAGYNSDSTKCLWIAKDNVDMKETEFDNIQEISKDEFDNYVSQWGL